MSVAPLYLWDDPAAAPRFLPFAHSRPLGELRDGALLLRERWSRAAGRPAAGHLAAAHLARFREPDAPPVVAEAAGPCVVACSTFAPALDARLPADAPARLVDGGGHAVAWVVPKGTRWSPNAGDAWPSHPLPGRRVEGVWQLVADLGTALRADLECLRGERPGGVVPRGATVLGDPALVVAAEATVEPHVVFDVRGGPVVLEPGVEVRAFTRLQGPLYAGAGTKLVGGELRESSIGPRCVIRGEMSNTLILGFTNKSHDGFVGHSVLGRWVNFGAGTTTSNLKNTYGPVRLNLGAERIETGMTFLGTLAGDHVKTAIGTMLPTGCLLGTGANVFGTRRPDSAVPPFAWGTDEAGRVLACRMFLQTASRVLPRRDVAADEATLAWLTDVWLHATGRPCD